MRIKKITKRNRDFKYDGHYNSAMPLVEPQVTVAVLVDKNTDPLVLHTMTRVEYSQGSNEFLYQNEENIEIEPEGKSLDPDILLIEVRNSIERCYKDAHDSCIENILIFPFPRVCPQVDLTNVFEKIKEDLA